MVESFTYPLRETCKNTVFHLIIRMSSHVHAPELPGDARRRAASGPARQIGALANVGHGRLGPHVDLGLLGTVLGQQNLVLCGLLPARGWHRHDA